MTVALAALVLAELLLVAVLAGGDGPFGMTAMAALTALAVAVGLGVAGFTAGALRQRPGGVVAALATGAGTGGAALWWVWVGAPDPVPLTPLLAGPVLVGVLAVLLTGGAARRLGIAYAAVALLTAAVALPLTAGDRAERARATAGAALRADLDQHVSACVDAAVAQMRNTTGTVTAAQRRAVNDRTFRCITAGHQGDRWRCFPPAGCEWRSEDRVEVVAVRPLVETALAEAGAPARAPQRDP